MALELTQPLTEMSTRSISWGVKPADAYDSQPYSLQMPIVLKSGSLILVEPSGTEQAYHGIALQCGYMRNVRCLRCFLWGPTLQNYPYNKFVTVYKYTMMCQSNTTKFYYVYYIIRATCFDSYRIIFRPF